MTHEEAIKYVKTYLLDEKYNIEALTTLIPELKESEDEMIRKEILNVFKELDEGTTICGRNYDYTKWIAWLERQGKQNMIPLDKVINFLDKQLVDDKDEVTGEPFINFQNYGTFKETFISFFKRKMLEKQGEKPIEKVEPKFKVGDWVVRGETIAQILDIQEQYYVGLDIDGDDFTSSRFLSDDKIHLWTINDAKEGDVLVASDETLFIFAGTKDNVAYYHYSLCKNGSQEISDGKHAWKSANSCHPATKEQSDTLEKAMADSGYRFDFETKELKKIGMVDNPKDYNSIDPHFGKQIESRPSWSEEDKKKLNRIYRILTEAADEHAFSLTCRLIGDKECMELQDFLRSLKPQPKQEWSEEDMKMIGTLVAIFEVNNPDSFYKVNPIGTTDMQGIHSSEIVKWLKTLKDRVQPQPKQEWSEEEVEIIDWLVVSFDSLKIPTNTFYLSKVRPFLISLRNKIQPIINEWSEEDEDIIEEIEAIIDAYVLEENNPKALIDWLKSLKDRYTWKPSEVQIEALESATENFAYSEYQDCLRELEEQLKKLKGE